MIRSSLAALVPTTLLTRSGVVRPERWSNAIAPYLPSNAGQAFMNLGSNPDLLTPAAGAAVFIGWLVALLAVAIISLRRRDA